MKWEISLTPGSLLSLQRPPAPHYKYLFFLQFRQHGRQQKNVAPLTEKQTSKKGKFFLHSSLVPQKIFWKKPHVATWVKMQNYTSNTLLCPLINDNVSRRNRHVSDSAAPIETTHTIRSTTATSFSLHGHQQDKAAHNKIRPFLPVINHRRKTYSVQ